MFFVTFLRRELWRRRKQAVVIALGLAVGIGLVITVTAAAAGVRAAQGRVLQSLYGVGTDITVTTKPAAGLPRPPDPGSASAPAARRSARAATATRAPPSSTTCVSGSYGPIPAADVASVRGPVRGHRGRRGAEPQRHPDQHPGLGGQRGLAAQPPRSSAWTART